MQVLPAAPAAPIEARVAEAADGTRALHESGEVEWTDLHPPAALQRAFKEELPDAEEAAEGT